MKKFSKNLIIYIMIFVAVISFASYYRTAGQQAMQTSEVTLSEFTNYIEDGKLTSIKVDGVTLTGELRNGNVVYAYASTTGEVLILEQDLIFPLMREGKLEVFSPKPSSGSFWLNVLPTIIMILSMVFLFYIMMNQGGNGKAFQFAKSKAKMVKDGDTKLTFKDVAGLDEEKQELEEIVDFLKFPKKYKELGARIPKGILLVGPPGTGKTYISKATAGEAGVPFFTISGSEFVEMFVGVGASRVRDLFDQAKKNAPCIVFIDEIDAVGRKRGTGIGGGHDEREQTLNQMLVEMDGFEENSGIIVMAATNRPDVLDPALLRPGRFDRQIVIGIPDVKGREEIIKVHTKNKPLADDVNPSVIARRTPGFSPADIENLLNEAALITARRNGRFIRMEEIEEAATKVMAGPAKKSRVISEKERRLTAYHEAGHAVVTRSLPGTDPVHQITIIPRGRAGGFTMYLPEDDQFFETKNDMFNYIVTCLGGRVAEQLTLDDISTGASNDIQKATDIAREMVTRYGFSDKLGTVNYAGGQEVFLGNDFTAAKNHSEDTARVIDEEVRRIVGEAYDLAVKILEENKDKLESVAKALLYIETLDGDQFEKLYNGEMSAEDLKQDHEEKQAEKAEKDKQETEERDRLWKEQEELEALEAAEAAKAEEDEEEELPEIFRPFFEENVENPEKVPEEDPESGVEPYEEKNDEDESDK